MLVVTRYAVPVGEAAGFLAQARAALTVLADAPGHQRGWIGRATDDPTLWTLTTEWRDVGSYRRALSRYEVKVEAVPLLSRAIDEPSAFEVLERAGDGADPQAGGAPSRRAADADTVGVGEASAAVVPTDLDGSQRQQR